MEVEDPLKSFFSPEERASSALPYLRRLRLTTEHEPAPTPFTFPEETPLTSPGHDGLSIFANLENSRVGYYLEILGRAEVEGHIQREMERQKARRIDEQRMAQFETLFSARPRLESVRTRSMTSLPPKPRTAPHYSRKQLLESKEKQFEGSLVHQLEAR
jgi:hypothetical protein